MVMADLMADELLMNAWPLVDSQLGHDHLMVE